MNKLKNAWKSVTIWFNGALLALLPLYDTFKDQFTDLQPYLPDNLYKWIGLIVVVTNIALRFKTSKALEDK